MADPRDDATDDATEGDLRHVRRSYLRAALDLADLPDRDRRDPLRVVRRWLDEAVDTGHEIEPTAMTLATVDSRGETPAPDARVVLCKQVDTGLVLYTNRASAKGRHLAAVPLAAAVFHWPSTERQVRVRGRMEDITDGEADEYFATRPRDSQVGAWASDQSAPVTDRAALDAQVAAARERFGDGPVPRPPSWGGYRLVPDEVELWQGRSGRLHDRLLATRTDDGWSWVRLQP